MEKAKTLAKVAGVEMTYQFPALLDTLKANGLIDHSRDTVAVLGLTTRGVLENTGKLFDSMAPTPSEHATLAVAELCSKRPISESDLSAFVSDTFKIQTQKSTELLRIVNTANLCDTETIDKTTILYFNGSLFRHDQIKKTKAVLDSLNSADQARSASFDQKLSSDGCVEKSLAMQMLGENLFRKLHSIGMYDVSTVSNPRENVEYVTRPSAFNKFGRSDVDDAFDLAKAFVASLQYGMTRSSYSRGQISMLDRLMQRLIDGHHVGPCTAIGHDYKILELRNVIQVIPDGSMYSMRLLKKDVGELALDVLRSGDASEQSLQLPGSSLNSFSGPEISRIKERARAHERNIDVTEALRSLRTSGI
jgi:hypothetical protein